MRDGELPPYNRRIWEPLWSACEELRMPLVTHVGGGTNARYSGLEVGRAPAARVGAVLAPRGVVDDLRRSLRAASRAEARDHRDARQLVPADRDRARRAPRVLRLEARRAVEQGAARAGAAASERVHGEQRVLRRELRVAVRGGAGDAARAGARSCSGDPTTRISKARSCTPTDARLPSVTRLALRNTFCDVPAAETGGWSARTRSTSTASMPAALHDDRPRDRRADARRVRHADRRRAGSGASVTAFRSGAGGWS